MEYKVTPDNVRIIDSYKVTDETIMIKWLTEIRNNAREQGFEYKRTNKSWIREWKAHNWLYARNIQKLQTKDVDLNENESLWKRLGYFILSLLK